MRPAWNGYITFGLVNIPISLYSAESHISLHFHLLDARDESRIRYQRVNEKTGKEVSWDNIVRAFQYGKDQYVIIKDKDFKKITHSANAIDIENFVPQQEIDSEYFEKPYYILPEKGGIKSYTLLHDALLKEKKAAIAKVTLHEREHLAAIVAKKDILILNILRYKKELRTLQELGLSERAENVKAKISQAEFNIAKQLINSMTTHWKPEKYHDKYKEELMAWVEHKEKGKKAAKAKIIKFKPPKETKELINLMKKSIRSLHETKTNKKIKSKKSLKKLNKN